MAGTNTCAQDTALTAWFLLSKFAGAKLPVSVRDTDNGRVLQEVVDLISNKQHDEACYVWCVEALELNPKGHHDLFRTMEDQFHKCVPELSRFRTEIHTQCSSPHCPEPNQTKIKNHNSALLPYGDRDTQQDLDRLYSDESECSVKLMFDQAVQFVGHWKE